MTKVTTKIDIQEFEAKMKELKTFDKYLIFLTYLMDCGEVEDCEKQVFHDYLKSDLSFLKFLWSLKLIKNKDMENLVNALIAFKVVFDEILENIQEKEIERIRKEKAKAIVIEANQKIIKNTLDQIDELLKANEVNNSRFFDEIKNDLQNLMIISKE